MKSSFVRAALAVLALVLAVPAAMAHSEPIPGVDIIVRKKPGGSAIVIATTDASGKFSARLAEPGDYIVSTACHPKANCPFYTLSISAKGASGKPGPDQTFTITFTASPATLSGAAVRKAGGGPSDITFLEIKLLD